MSGSPHDTEDFASIKDHNLLPTSPRRKSAASSNDGQVSQMLRLSREGSGLTRTEEGMTRRETPSPQSPTAPADSVFATPSLSVIRQAMPTSPLVAAVAQFADVLISSGPVEAGRDDDALHSSSGSLGVVSVEDGAVALSGSARWAVTAASAAAAAAALANASTPRDSQSPPSGSLAAATAASAAAAASNAGAVLSAEEFSPNGSTGSARPRTSPLLTNSATRRRAQQQQRTSGAVMAASVNSVVGLSHGTSPPLSAFPSLLAPPSHSLTGPPVVANGLDVAQMEPRDQRSNSCNLHSVPRRKLRESEVSFSVDVVHTAPSPPLSVYTTNSPPPGQTSPVISTGSPPSPPSSSSAVLSPPNAELLSVATSACMVSPVTEALLAMRYDCVLPKALSPNDSDTKQQPEPLMSPGSGPTSPMGAPLTRTALADRVPHPPPLADPLQRTPLSGHALPSHSQTAPFMGGAGSSTTSSRVSVTAGGGGAGAMAGAAAGAASTTSSFGCFQSTSTHGGSIDVAVGAYPTGMMTTPVPTAVIVRNLATMHDANNNNNNTSTSVNNNSSNGLAMTGDARDEHAPLLSDRRGRRPTPLTSCGGAGGHLMNPLASATTTATSGANNTLRTHSTDDGLPATAMTSAAGTHSCVALSHDSSNSNGPARSAFKARGSGGSATAGHMNGSSTGGGGGVVGGDQTVWGSSDSNVPRDDQTTPVNKSHRVFLPMNLVVVVNLVVTVAIVALLAILPLNEVSVRTIHYITSVLSKGLANSFTSSTEANLFFLPLALRSFVASWMINQRTQFMPWTREDMPSMMQNMCNLIQKTSSSSHLLYVGMYSPYSGYSAYCSPQYMNNTAMYGNYIINNESEPRYRIGPDFNYVQPLEPLAEVYAMNPWDEAVSFGSPNNSWINVAVPWYRAQVESGSMEPTAMGESLSDARSGHASASPASASSEAVEEFDDEDLKGGGTTISSIAEGWWVSTIENVSVITYSWPFIDYEGNLAMFTAGLQTHGLFDLFAESLGSASLGKAMVVDPATGMVLFSSWREEPPMSMDHWDWSSCHDCSHSSSLYMDEVVDPLMRDAISSLGGRSGLLNKPFSVSEWEQEFRHRGKEATVFAHRILFTDGTDDEHRTVLHLVMIYAIEKAEYSSNVEVVRSAILAAVALTLAIIAVMDMALIYLFLRPLRNLAVGLRDAAQLRDGSAIVACRISAIKEVANMQHNFFLMNQQLMRMKAFVPQGVLGPTMSAWSGSDRATDRGSDFGNDDSFVFFTGPRPVDSREISSVSNSVARAGGAPGSATLGMSGAAPRAFSPQLYPQIPRDDVEDEQLPFEQDAGGGALTATKASHGGIQATGESLRLNERALFDEVNRFRRRYCTVMVACMHICERDLVNQPKMELLISMFMNAAIPVILKDGGVIETQRPDMLVVSFGAHSRMAMHQTRGARCALEIVHRVNEFPALGARVGCMVDVSEFYVGTFGAAQRNARVTYGVRMPMSLELVKLYKSLNTQILLTQKLAAALDRQFLVMPIDSLLFTLDSKSRVLYELRGSVRTLPPAIPEAYIRSIIKAVRYGFNKMVHGEYEGAMRYLEPYAQHDDQVRRLAQACQSLINRGVTKPYIRSIGRIKLSEASVLYDVEEQEQVRRVADAAATVNGSLSTSMAARNSSGSAQSTGVFGTPSLSNTVTSAGAQSTSYSSRHYLQRGPQFGVGAGGTTVSATSTVSPVDPMLEAAIRRQHNKKALRIISGSAPVDAELSTSLDVGAGAVPASGGAADAGDGTVAVVVSDSTLSSPRLCGDESESESAAGGGGGGGALFEMFIDVDDGDGPEVATLASTTHTITEEAMGNGGSCASINGSAQGLHVQASAAPASRGHGGDDDDEAGTGHGDGHGAGGENIGDLPTTLEDYEGNMWFRSADRLGVGAFSVVYRGLSASGNLVALKCFQLLSRNVDYEAVSEEVRLFASLHHENIVQYISVYISDTFFVEIMELVPGGSLDALLKSFGHVHKRALRRFLRDILRGLQYLHSMNIVHCDVKPHNVLLAMDGQCKLSDFGSAMTRAASSLQHIEDVLELRGTPGYLAPEVARGEIPTMKSDVFSLGVTILELLDGALPWRFAETASAANSHTHANLGSGNLEDESCAPLPGTGRLGGGGAHHQHQQQEQQHHSHHHNDNMNSGVPDACGTLASSPLTSPNPSATTRRALTPQEEYQRMWRRSAVEAVFSRPHSTDGDSGTHAHSDTTTTGDGDVHDRDGQDPLMTTNVNDASSGADHTRSTGGSNGSHHGDGAAGRTEGSESPKTILPRFQRRGTCAPSTCPLIDDLEGLTGHSNGSMSGTADNRGRPTASLSSASATSGPTRGPSTGSPTTVVPFGANGRRVSSRPGTGSSGLDGVFSGHSRPVSAEKTADGITLDRILRNPTQLIRSIANGVVMPYIPDDLAADDELVDFLKLCLHPDANKRASADQLLNHSWLM